MTGMAVRSANETPVTGSVPRFELTDWRREFGVVAGVTGRDDDFNLGLWTDEPARHVLDRWAALRAALGEGFVGAAVARQVHGSAIRTYHEATPGLLVGDGLDGHVTRTPGLLLTVTVADCVPVYLLHPATGTLGLVHAGWRGTALGAVGRGIAVVCEVGGAVPSDLLMHCGISICGSCYEVGPEVQEAVTGARAPGPAPLDLRHVLARQAAGLGVGRITASRWCTAEASSRFYSHRRSGGADGRMVAYLGRPMA